MKEYTILPPQTIKSFASRMADLLYSKIEYKESEFLRESEIFMLFGVLDDIELDNESINEIFYYVNNLFKLYPTLMDYKYIEVKEQEYQGYKERAFEFKYGSTLEELAYIVNQIKYNDEKNNILKQQLTSEHIECKVKSVAYNGLFLICILESDSEFTKYRIFLFNSFYTSLKVGETINILISDFETTRIYTTNFCYKKNEFQENEYNIFKKKLLDVLCKYLESE